MAPFTVVFFKEFLQPGCFLVCNEHALVLAAFFTETKELTTQSNST